MMARIVATKELFESPANSRSLLKLGKDLPIGTVPGIFHALRQPLEEHPAPQLAMPCRAVRMPSRHSFDAVLSGIDVLKVHQCRHVAALMHNAQYHRLIPRSRYARVEDDMPSVVHGAQASCKQAPVTTAIWIGHNALESTYESPVIRQPLVAAPSLDCVAPDFVEVPQRKPG